MLKVILYLFFFGLSIYLFEGIDINAIFKKNRVYQARIFYFLLIVAFSYLCTNFFFDIFEAIAAKGGAWKSIY